MCGPGSSWVQGSPPKTPVASIERGRVHRDSELEGPLKKVSRYCLPRSVRCVHEQAFAPFALISMRRGSKAIHVSSWGPRLWGWLINRANRQQVRGPVCTCSSPSAGYKKLHQAKKLPKRLQEKAPSPVWEKGRRQLLKSPHRNSERSVSQSL